MAEKKPATPPAHAHGLFDKQNLWLMLLGGAIIAVGMLLMVGGNSNDPTKFIYEEVYSARRVSLAPVLIIIGLGIEIYAIFKKTK